MRVIVDYDRCDSYGICADTAPDVFEIRDDDLMHVVADRPADDQHELVETAVRSCPKLALSVRDG